MSQIAVQRVRRALFWSVALALLVIVGVSAMAWWRIGLAKETLIETKSGPIKVETVAKKLQFPWGLAFLPDGRMLVTERPGRLRIVAKDGTLSEPIKGVPEVFAQGQGGLLGITLDPDFTANKLIYFAYAEPGEGGAGHGGGARQARRRQPRRRRSHLPAKAQGRRRQPFRRRGWCSRRTASCS